MVCGVFQFRRRALLSLLFVFLVHRGGGSGFWHPLPIESLSLPRSTTTATCIHVVIDVKVAAAADGFVLSLHEPVHRVVVGYSLLAFVHCRCTALALRRWALVGLRVAAGARSAALRVAAGALS